jgi:hypothetical protein
MGMPHRQRGLGWFGLLFVFGTLAFVAICVIKIGPLYLNQFTVAAAVKGVADDPELANAEPAVIRDRLRARWDVDYIDQLDYKDIKLKRTDRGRVLSYDYEARVNLFYNIYVAIQFKEELPMRASATASNY